MNEEYIVEIGGCAVKEEGDTKEVCVGPVKFIKKLVRCKDCANWQTEIAYITTGRCKYEGMRGLICNKNFFCGYGKEKT